MENERRSDFCTSCRRETSYKMRKKIVPKVIKDKTYEFEIAVAVCEECGKEMDIPGLLDTNIKSIDEQYRQAEGVINVGDIYNIRKAHLSIVLGFGEVKQIFIWTEQSFNNVVEIKGVE